MILSCYMVIVAIVSLNILICPNESLKTAKVGTSSMALHMPLKVFCIKPNDRNPLRWYQFVLFAFSCAIYMKDVRLDMKYIRLF